MNENDNYVSASINDCNYLFLREIGEPEDNSLRLVIEEAKATGPVEDIEVIPGQVISGTRPIESDHTCRAFELIWPSYVAYSVRNESFCQFDDTENSEGRLFRLYARSHFLDYVRRATFAGPEYPGPFQHWEVICLNHIFDVVSVAEPIVREIDRDDDAPWA